MWGYTFVFQVIDPAGQGMKRVLEAQEAGREVRAAPVPLDSNSKGGNSNPAVKA